MSVSVARHRRIAPVRKTPLRCALMVGTALGGLAFSVSPALAQDECGVPVAGQVVCTAGGNPYDMGITYNAPSPLGVTLQVGAHVVTSADSIRGLTVHSDTAAQVISDGSVQTTGEGGDALFVTSFGDLTLLATGDISTTGDFAAGVLGGSSDASANVSVHNVSVAGLDSVGVEIYGASVNVTATGSILSTARTNGSLAGLAAYSHAGDAVVSAREVYTSGDHVDGIRVDTNYNPTSLLPTPGLPGDAYVTINGQVVTLGDHADGVDAQSLGVVSFTNNGHVDTAGFNSYGVRLDGDQGVVLAGDGTIRTLGTGATGLSATSADGSINGSVGFVQTHGGDATGVLLNSDELDVAVARVATQGDYAIGVWATAPNIALAIGDVTTAGAHAGGVNVNGDTVILDIGNLTTGGDGATGVRAIANGSLDLAGTGLISTAGDVAHAVNVTVDGTAEVDLADVSTSGDGSEAVSILAGSADVRITGDVTSTGEQSPGGVPTATAAVKVSATTGDATVEVNNVHAAHLDAVSVNSALGDVTIVVNGEVSTAADDAPAVYAVSSTGQTFVTNNGAIVTAGARSFGVSAYGYAGVAVDGAGSVHTSGENAYGVVASSFGGAVSVAAGPITTLGADSHGVLAFALDQSVSVTAGPVSTAGHGSNGIVAQGGAGSVDIAYTGVDTAGDNGTAIHALADGDVSVSGAGAISTQGASSYGVRAQSRAGVASVTAGPVSTAGEGAVGLLALGQLGASATTQGPVSTLGDQATAIAAISDQGPVIVNFSGPVTTSGAESEGVHAVAEGDVTITGDGPVSTAGANAAGVNARSFSGAASITTGAVSTAGPQSDAIRAEAESGVTIQANGPLSTAGDFSSAIDAYSSDGPASVDFHGDITTLGLGSRGLDIYANGNLSVTGVGAITTAGDYAAGMVVLGAGVTSVAAGPVTTTGQGSFGIYAQGDDGLTVAANGPISTTGDQAAGVTANGSDGPVSVTTGAITTGGENASGIIAFSGGGSVSVTAGPVSTSGAYAYGVIAVASGQANVQAAGPISTAGANAWGIAVNAGVADVAWQGVTTTGDGAYGVAVQGEGDVAVSGGAVTTTGVEAHAIQASSDTGEVTVNATSVSTQDATSHGILASGAGTVQVNSGFVSAGGVAISATSSAGSAGVAVNGGATSLSADAVQVSAATTANVTVGEDAVIEGAVNSVRMTSVDGSALVNNGLINTLGGYAIQIDGGAADILNAGALGGRFDLTDEADVFTNSGLFLAAGDSRFGAGDDLFTNSGTLEVSGVAGILGLETFANSGLIDLADGSVGTRLVLDGSAFDGAGGGALAIDVDFAAATADLLTVGTASGTTRLLVNSLGGAAGAIGSEILVVQAQAPSEAGAFGLPGGGITSGLLRYDVVYKPATLGYYLATEASQSALALAAYPQTVRTLWYKSADTWTQHLAAERDAADGAASDQERSGFWLQPYGEVDRRTETFLAPLSGQQAGLDLTHSQDYFGAQAGGDIVRSTSAGRLMLGVTGGYLSSHLNARETDDRAVADVWNLGAYATWSSGDFFAHALVKYDDYAGDLQSLQSGFEARLDGRSWGGMIELGHRMGVSGYVLEPFASLGYVETDVDGFEVGGVEAAFETERSLRGRIGARFGAHVRGAGFVYGGASYVREFEGTDAASIDSGGGALVVQGRGAPEYGEASLGVSVGAPGPVTGFFEARARFGSTEGGGVRAGVKVAF